MSGSRRLALSLLMLCSPAAVLAGGPLALFDPVSRTPYAYPPGAVSVYTDLGANGLLTNTQSDALVANAFAQWTAVPSAYFSAAIVGEIQVGGMATDITLANVDSIISTQFHTAFNGGGIHVIYDSDGSIVSGFFGAPPGVAGIASPEFSDTNSPDLLESWVVLNGSLVDPGDTSPYPGATFEGIYTHEIGHSINLAHSQTNGAIIFFGDNDGPSGCASLGGVPDLSDIETMYPFIDNTPGSTGLYQATVEQLDDVAALSNLYPTGGWPVGGLTITGKIFMPDHTTEVTGVNVIARNLADPLGDCISALSGDYTQGSLGAPDGLYTLHGLTPGAQYVVYVDAIVDGGFSTPPANFLFFEEYYNGVRESGDVEADTTCSYVTLSGGAGTSQTADILLNVDPSALVLADDDAVEVDLPFSFPFCNTLYSSVWVNSNGNVTFGFGDTNPSADGTGLRVGPPRICGLWDDLDPSSGGVITAKAVGGNFVVSFLQVPEYLFGGPNTFSITLRPDGTHRVAYGQTLTFFSTVAGRSPGAGAPDPGPTDLSAAPQPLGQGVDTVYEEFFFGDDLTSVTLEYAICGDPVGVAEEGVIPASFGLLQSRPNPFRAGTVISFDLPQAGAVTLRVFDLRGRLVTTIADEILEAGRYSFPWSGVDDAGSDVAPGIYFYRLETPGFEATRKAIRVE